MFPSLVADTAGPGGVWVLFEVAITTSIVAFWSSDVHVTGS